MSSHHTLCKKKKIQIPYTVYRYLHILGLVGLFIFGSCSYLNLHCPRHTDLLFLSLMNWAISHPLTFAYIFPFLDCSILFSTFISNIISLKRPLWRTRFWIDSLLYLFFSYKAPTPSTDFTSMSSLSNIWLPY